MNEAKTIKTNVKPNLKKESSFSSPKTHHETEAGLLV